MRDVHDSLLRLKLINRDDDDMFCGSDKLWRNQIAGSKNWRFFGERVMMSDAMVNLEATIAKKLDELIKEEKSNA